ncbi:hypothetical protein BABINDRAFT_160695 [Babjeviella inositovora NRRL Y-12698]|uniref:ferric-chelate reductase (NADPH) n=1 Tax=Babjeviella inositovora NRRL Y-12698 TaxID=984486 RepID=A0A1E3QUJ2_9ASCO|nr:uncharacterized protein BABINDRAFT_160695 [Babjeviella inositovora NRRL Y-12698]ODQ81336.1 hypothetical protein BABINDRAFT_160695 [Babjeviella inositovora NRRL Y-12698]
MVKLRSLLTLAVASLAVVEGNYHIYTHQEYAVMACSGVIEKTTTFCPAVAGMGHHMHSLMPSCYCTNVVEMGSLLICLHQMGYYNLAMVKYLTKKCYPNHIPAATDALFFDGVYQNATQYVITPEETLNASLVTYSPIYVRATNVTTYYEAYYNRWSNFTLSLNLGAGFFALFAAYMIISGIGNWSLILFPGLVSKMNGPVSKRFRALVSLPATFRKDKNVPLKFWGVPVGYIPTRLESIVIALLWVYLILACAFGYHSVSGNPYWSRPMGEISRYISDRSGILALFMYPLVVLFAGRNNFLIYLTRWSFARFNTYHRHISRIFFAFSLVHSIGMTIYAFSYPTARYASWMRDPFITWGAVATVAMGVMLAQGVILLRRKSYESFLIIHIVLAVFVLIGCHYHIALYGYQGFTWSVVGIWAFDRVVRWIRMAGFEFQEATVTLKAADTLKVTVPNPTTWKCQPGQYAFISFMKPSSFWQSHPFTVICESESELSFAIKIKGGVTNGLYKHLITMPAHTAKIKVAIDGPYGFSSPAHKYNQSLLMASGHGIPGLYDHAMRLANTKHSVKLIWIIRDYKSISWMLEEMQKLRETKVETVIYVTRPNEVLDSPLGSSDSRVSFSDKDEGGKAETSNQLRVNSVDQIQKDLPHVSFREGRPDIDCIVKEEITLAHGTLAVVACGHDSMVDSVRCGVVANLTKSKHRVDYFEELQAWA